jgi:Type II secretion system (T2SS), protein F
METFNQLFFAAREFRLELIALALIAGAAVFLIFFGLVTPPKGKPTGKTVKAVREAASRSSQREMVGIQARLDKANLEISATEFVKRSLILGIPLGLGLYILIGAIVLFAVGVLAGFMFTWTDLQQKRDRKTIQYAKLLASSCDTIRTAYGVNPSLKRAIEAAAEFSQSPLKEDYQEMMIALSQERFVEGLQTIADKRRSIVFDGVAIALIRASEATGEVGEMLHRLAVSTRQNVSAFEEALSTQINARSNITWGTYGPWMIFTAFKGITFLVALLFSEANFFSSANAFFGSFLGNVVALFASGISIMVNRYANATAQRGLVIGRINSVDAQATAGSIVARGQSSPSMDTSYSRQGTLSAQSRPSVGA